MTPMTPMTRKKTPLEALTKALIAVEGNVSISRCGVEILVPATWDAPATLVVVASPHTRGVDVSLRVINNDDGETKIVWELRQGIVDAWEESIPDAIGMLMIALPQVRDHLREHGLSAPFRYKAPDF